MINRCFESVSPERWSAIKAKIAEQTGVEISTDSGSGEYKGVKYTWAYGGNDLAIEIVSVSFIDKMIGQDEETVMSEFANWIEGVQ